MNLNEIIHGDSLQVLSTFSSETFDLIIVDYPFSYFIDEKGERNVKEEELSEFIRRTADEFYRVLKPEGNLTIFWQSIMAYKYTKYFSDLFLVRNVVCVKDIIKWSWAYLPYQYNLLYLLTKGERTKNWYKIPKTSDFWDDLQRDIDEDGRYHKEQMSMKNIKKVLKLMSKEGDLVLDAFSGGGNVVVACKKLNRRFIGIEINLDSYLTSKERIEYINRQRSI